MMNKRILIAADIHTHPVRGGNQQCIMQYVKLLRRLGCEVFFLYLDLYEGRCFDEETRAYWGDHFFCYRTPLWQTVCQKIRRRIERCYYSPYIDVYYPKGLTDFVNELHERYRFDGLIVNYVWNSRLSACNIPIRSIFTHDVFTNRNEKLEVKDAWYSFPQEEERKGISRFAEVLSIQDEEAEWFRKLAPGSRVRCVYSPFDYVHQPVTGNKNILFFSGGGPLNKDGITRFLHDVWPLLRENDDEITLLLGGRICEVLSTENLPEGVVPKGEYDNPDDFYLLGDICINPVYNGSGLKIKTLESLAHGKLTVVDPHNALGLYRLDSIPLYRAITAQDYADVILRFMGNSKALAAQKTETEHYIRELNMYIHRQYAELFGISL